MSFNHRDIELLYEIGSLRYIQRAWRQQVGIKVANDLEHTMRVIWLSLILARREGVKDEEKIIKLALVHDIGETRTGDHNYMQRVYVKSQEEKAAQHLFSKTSLEDFAQALLQEYEGRASLEAQIVKDADNLDIDLELRELANQGSQMLTKWHKTRQLVRDEKLYTQSARDLWDELDNVDVADWHLTANKWYKIPSAGK
jgi:putative hydrolase of HD superfamily